MHGKSLKTHHLKLMDDHRDNRGYVLNPFEFIADTGSITNCHAFSIEPCCSRGGHAHPGRNEEVLILRGALTVSFPEMETSTVISTDKPALLCISQGVCHLFENMGEETAVALCWSSAGDDEYEGPDTIRI